MVAAGALDVPGVIGHLVERGLLDRDELRALGWLALGYRLWLETTTAVVAADVLAGRGKLELHSGRTVQATVVRVLVEAAALVAAVEAQLRA